MGFGDGALKFPININIKEGQEHGLHEEKVRLKNWTAILMMTIRLTSERVKYLLQI